MGNENHPAFCGLSGVLFSSEMVEGKNCLAELGAPKYDALGGKMLAYCCIYFWVVTLSLIVAFCAQGIE